jgi:murein DD-endopeptidase MepM/ murein hydrolase activator NlpD
MTNPVPGYVITYPWGVKNDRYASGYHTGDDYFAPEGADVVAARGGVVEVSGYSSLWGASYGQVVVVSVPTNDRPGDDVKCLYAHTSKQFVKAGQRVQTGQRIAAVGATGTNSTGPHLHYEERTFPWLYNNQDRRPQFQAGQGEDPVTKEEMREIVDMLLGTKLFGDSADKDLRDVTVQTALRRTYLGHDEPREV